MTARRCGAASQFEVYETPNARVLLRRSVPCLVTSQETTVVQDAVRQNPKAQGAIIDTKRDTITVHMPSLNPCASAEELAKDYPFCGRAKFASVLPRSVLYMPTMRFVLQDAETREYQTERWCYLGSIDDWIQVEAPGPLPQLAHRFSSRRATLCRFDPPCLLSA